MDSKKFLDIEYVSNAHDRQRLDLYVPQTGSRHALIVYIHGGAFMYGSKDSNLIPKIRLLEKGYAVASLDYRLSGDAIFPAAVDDCKAAVRWLRAHASEYDLNTDRIVAWGESAGAHHSAMLGTTAHVKDFDVGDNLDFSSAVQGVVDYYGPTDFLQMDAHAPPGANINGTPFKHDAPDSPESRYIGATIQEHPEKVQKANPINYVSSGTAPFIIAHGTKDQIVPFHQSELLYDALKKAGVPVVWHPVEGTDHVFKGIEPEQTKALDEATDKFLESIFDPNAQHKS